ncbi:PAS domain-containing protein [Burkholderia plantarii]|uniref:PAS domain-containing protein n=1 Tax=Burkholderia plantarii TaxID=41899 RepID=UPI0018DD79EB|nr:PAS domain-containing protein [Burkholderia plantarii]MBI0329887.1 PAS domain S-box protein [Burkholderia plantarii]
MTETSLLDGFMIDQAPDALIASDARGTIIRWNLAAEALLGYRADEALGRNLDLLIPPPLRAAHWRGFERAMRTGRTKHHGEAVLTAATHKDGTRRYAEVAFSLIRDGEGRIAGALAIARPKRREE